MHLSFVNANILHQVLEERINIVYNPHNSIFDKILYLLDASFFVFNDEYKSGADNCSSLQQQYIDLYNYDICIFNGMVTASQHNIDKTLHINSLIIEHGPRTPNLKKEDLVILNNKNKGVKKIFFDQDYMSTWNQSDSIHMIYGIPLHIFKDELSTSDRKQVLIHANTMMSNQLQQHLNQQNITSASFNADALSLNQINKKLNNYQIVMNLNNDPVMTLVSIAAGCKVITLNGDINTNIPGTYNHSSVEAAVACLHRLLRNQTEANDDSAKQYLSEKHSFDLFKIKLQDLIRTIAKREAFIL